VILNSQQNFALQAFNYNQRWTSFRTETSWSFGQWNTVISNCA